MSIMKSRVGLSLRVVPIIVVLSCRFFRLISNEKKVFWHGSNKSDSYDS